MLNSLLRTFGKATSAPPRPVLRDSFLEHDFVYATVQLYKQTPSTASFYL